MAEHKEMILLAEEGVDVSRWTQAVEARLIHAECFQLGRCGD